MQPATYMRQVFLIGHPVGHSVSPAMQNAAFRALGLDLRYDLLDTPPPMLKQGIERLRDSDCAGANVTIPHKEAVVPLLDRLTENARRVGAVNTIFKRGDKLVGENTDGVGFRRALEEARVETRGARVVLLGAGGAACAVAFALRDAAHIAIVNRTRERAERLVGELRQLDLPVALTGLDEVPRANLIVNATSVGMYPNAEDSPLPREVVIPRGTVVFDLVYRPARTRLLQDAERARARALGGLGMLVYQGAEAFRLWTGYDAPVGVMGEAAQREVNGAG